LFHFSFGRFGYLPETPIPSASPLIGRTPILIGYSNALFALGWRYERAGGTSRNLPEAIRCYRKSARLGNAGAMARLAPDEQSAPAPVIPIPT
jgi:TPR repeat protein